MFICQAAFRSLNTSKSSIF